MNKKGYTLIELIAVVVIIAMVAIIIVVNFDKILGKSDDKKVSAFESDLEKAACVYVDLKENNVFKSSCYPNTCTVTVASLISSGLVKDDTIDPVTNNTVSKTLTVSVTWDNEGTKNCTLNR